MFTGIIRELGIVSGIEQAPAATLLSLSSTLSAPAATGSSIAVNGACLTVLPGSGGQLNFRLMAETLKKTNLGKLRPKDRVNLESPLTISDSLDGHFVLGHVDGVARVVDIKKIGEDRVFTFQPPSPLLVYLVPKGSIALDGVSLTIVDVRRDTFTVSMMPYTLAHTIFGTAAVGYEANIEIDMIAKNVVHFLQTYQSTKSKIQTKR